MPRLDDTHERLADGRPPARGSDRAFGAAFAVVFAIGGAVAWLRGGEFPAWPFVVSGAFLVAAFLTPELLAPLNKLRVRALNSLPPPPPFYEFRRIFAQFGGTASFASFGGTRCCLRRGCCSSQALERRGSD